MSDHEEDGDVMWDAKDVARFFRASQSWVYRQAEAGVLPHVRVVGLLRFHADEIRAFAKGAKPAQSKVLPFTKKGTR